MSKSPQLTTRLNVSLIDDDPIVLEKLRNILEKRFGKRLSWAEVIRIAFREAAKANKN